jgi:hypothetical protein
MSGRDRVPALSVGIGLVDRGRLIVVAEVFASSPLEGLLWPGDVIHGAGESQRSSPLQSARKLASSLFATARVELSVETPADLAGATSAFLIAPESAGPRADLGVQIEKDGASCFGRVAAITPGSVAAEVAGSVRGAPCLQEGDLLVAVGYGGALREALDWKEARDLVAAAASEGGAIELRVVRPGGMNETTIWTQSSPNRAYDRMERPTSVSPPPYDACSTTSTLTAMLSHARLVNDDIGV